MSLTASPADPRALAVALLLLAAAAPALAADPICSVPSGLAALGAPLPAVAALRRAHDEIVIVAFGSSSTQGAGATRPDRTYPARLEGNLRILMPESAVRVHNRGRGGDSIPAMLERLDRDVLSLRPHLVVWQLGVNDVINVKGVAQLEVPIREGVRRLRRAGADIVLMDLQHAPRVLADHDAEAMQALLARIARDEAVGLFSRFAVMRHWIAVQGIPLRQAVDPDGLHMTDWSYGCIATALAGAIARASSPQRTDPAPRPNPQP
ncbi:MAG: SGNH/GDSL hydrolase family protein [Alphaproteobacteria bacterium]|nr:SGNH/GDSL hydrolase family protein [Alphaproteobacteria bacterium]